jgi:hypothetical protein
MGTSSDGPGTVIQTRSIGLCGRSRGTRPCSSPRATSRGSAPAGIPGAGGSFSTPPRAAPGGGARWPCAGTGTSCVGSASDKRRVRLWREGESVSHPSEPQAIRCPSRGSGACAARAEAAAQAAGGCALPLLVGRHRTGSARAAGDARPTLAGCILSHLSSPAVGLPARAVSGAQWQAAVSAGRLDARRRVLRGGDMGRPQRSIRLTETSGRHNVGLPRSARRSECTDE